ncbi:hypothetical protein ACJJTC_001189 [Scirpophaga incertulas]
MAPIKCCVSGCSATNLTHRLYSFPKDDNLQALWLSFLVPFNSDLLGLSKDQLLNKRVCQKHFDRSQLDGEGKRLKGGYPCLFSAKEMEHGVPLSSHMPVQQRMSDFCKKMRISDFCKSMKKIADKEKKNQKSFSDRLDAAKNLGRSTLFNNNFNKMSQHAQDFIMMQLKMVNKKKKAMRYTTNEKHLALAPHERES